MMGALAGVAAMLDLTRFATTNIGGHQTTALAAIAAVVIGGTSLLRRPRDHRRLDGRLARSRSSSAPGW